jgi:cyanophycin synthetase
MGERVNLNELRANQRFLARELLARGVTVTLFDRNNEILEATLGDHRELLSDIDSSIMPYTASVVAGSKSITKRLLNRAGISTPRGHYFSSEDAGEIARYAQDVIGFPVVVKPSFGVQGENVFTTLESVDEVLAAVQAIVTDSGNQEIIVEEYFRGHEFRVFMTARGGFAALYREPAHIIGDGFHSIELLASWESYRRMHPRTNCLCPISLDGESAHYLKRRGLSPLSVPRLGEKVYLRGSSNVKKGGVPTDVTDFVHPSAREICAKALAAIPGLPYAGIDFMCADIRNRQEGDSYRVLEINSVPGIGIHMAPGRGSPRNVAGMIVDMIFPETIGKRRETACAA